MIIEYKCSIDEKNPTDGKKLSKTLNMSDQINDEKDFSSQWKIFIIIYQKIIKQFLISGDRYINTKSYMEASEPKWVNPDYI